MKKKIFVIASLILSVLLMAACATEAAVVEEEAAPAEAAGAGLSMTGAAEMNWSVDDLAAMTQIDADYTGKDGETTTYTGVAINDLLAAAGVEEYTAINMVASDDYAAEVTFDELSACATCLIAVEDDGSMRSVMPDMSGKLNVKNLVEIQVQ